MKAKQTITSCLFVLLAGLFSSCATAQDNLNALVKKCESMESVDMNIVYQKDKETKKTQQVIKSLTIENNKDLVTKFLEAFKKDKEKAYTVIENKQNGKIVPSFYRFSTGNTDISYSFSLDDDANASVSVIERPE
jgi:hypothetical protein